MLAGIPWQHQSNYTALQGHDLLIHHPSGLPMTWVDTGPPGTKWLLVPRLQLRPNLPRLTSSPVSSAALDELGPNAIFQTGREKIPFVLMEVLHECDHGASEDSVTHVEYIQWAKKSGNTLTQEGPGG